MMDDKWLRADAIRAQRLLQGFCKCDNMPIRIKAVGSNIAPVSRFKLTEFFRAHFDGALMVSVNARSREFDRTIICRRGRPILCKSYRIEERLRDICILFGRHQRMEGQADYSPTQIISKR